MNEQLPTLWERTKQLQKSIKHLLPSEVQVIWKLISIILGVIRLLRFLNWLKNRIVSWCQRQSSKQEETLSNQSRGRRHFDYTYIEGLIRELEDEMDRLEEQGYMKAEILGRTLVGVFGIFYAVVQMAWDSLFIRKKPKS